VRSDTTIPGLHAVLGPAFGWSDVHVHRFKVHGRELDATDGPQVRLRDLGLRVSERFADVYDFGDLWCDDVRVEQILDLRLGAPIPVAPADGEPARRRAPAAPGLSWDRPRPTASSPL
jgi:hypothetical protein